MFNNMDLNNIIKEGRLENNIYYLPDIQLDRKEYLDLAKHLNFLGGKWKGGKIKGFVFDREINTIDELLGNNIKVKKEIQLFETPEEIADELVKLANIKDSDKILEPSAGRGRIIKAIQKVYNGIIDYCEINHINRDYLNKIENIKFITHDFLDMSSDSDFKYNKIIANPPFNKNQDIAHIFRMYDLLNVGGVLVSIASKHWEYCNNKKERYFREWLKNINAKIIPIESGKFKDSGTLIGMNIIIIKK